MTMPKRPYPRYQRRHHSILLAVCRNPAIKQREIAKETGYSSSQISRILCSPDFVDPSATSDALGEWPDTGGYRLDRRFNRHVETIKHGHGDQACQHKPFDTDSMRRGPRQHDE